MEAVTVDLSTSMQFLDIGCLHIAGCPGRATVGAVLPASQFISASIVVLGVRLVECKLNLAVDNRTDCLTYIALNDELGV